MQSMFWYSPTSRMEEEREVPESDDLAVSLLDGDQDSAQYIALYKEYRTRNGILEALSKPGDTIERYTPVERPSTWTGPVEHRGWMSTEDEARRARGEEASRLEARRLRLSEDVMKGDEKALEVDRRLEKRIRELARRSIGGNQDERRRGGKA